MILWRRLLGAEPVMGELGEGLTSLSLSTSRIPNTLHLQRKLRHVGPFYPIKVNAERLWSRPTEKIIFSVCGHNYFCSDITED